MKYLFNSVKELREFVKNDFLSSYKIELVEKDDQIIAELDNKQIATIPYNICTCDNQSMYVIEPNEIKSLNFIFDQSITFEEIANNENTKEINVMTNSNDVKCITFKYRDKYDIEIKSFGMYEITINSTISTKANHFTNIFKSIDKETEKLK
mgnify:CR=1 FL=1